MRVTRTQNRPAMPIWLGPNPGPPMPALGTPRAGIGASFSPFQGHEPRQPPKTAPVTVHARNGALGASPFLQLRDFR